MFVAATGFSQLARIFMYRRAVKNGEIIPQDAIVVAAVPTAAVITNDSKQSGGK
jgi:hypothetical protein